MIFIPAANCFFSDGGTLTSVQNLITRSATFKILNILFSL